MFAVPFVARVVYHSGVPLRSRFFVCLTLVPEVVYHSGVLLRSDLCVCRSICGQGGVSQRSSSPLCHLCLPFHLSPWCIRAEFFSASISLQVTIECFWRPVVLERSCSPLRSVSNIQVWQGIDRFMSRSCVVGNDVEFHTSMLLDSLLSNSATPIAFISAGLWTVDRRSGRGRNKMWICKRPYTPAGYQWPG